MRLFFQWRPEGHHAATCKIKWQLGTTSKTSSSVPQHVPQVLQQVPQQPFAQSVIVLDLGAIKEAV